MVKVWLMVKNSRVRMHKEELVFQTRSCFSVVDAAILELRRAGDLKMEPVMSEPHPYNLELEVRVAKIPEKGGLGLVAGRAIEPGT